MSLAYHSIHTFVARIATVASGFAITLITARLLDVQGRGAFAILVLAASVYTTVLGGLGSAMVYQISHKRRSPQKVFWTVMIFAAGAGGALFLAGILLSSWLQSAGLGFLVYFIVAAPCILLIVYLGALLLGLNAIQAMNYVSLSPYLMTLTIWGGIILIGHFSLPAAMAGWVVAYAVASAGALYLCRHYILPVSLAWDRQMAREITIFGSKIGSVNLVGVLNYRIDMLLVQVFLGLETLGIYSIAVSVAELLWYISSSISAAAYSRIGQSSHEEAGILTATLIRMSIALISVAVLIMAAGGYFLIPAVFGPQYRDAVWSFEVLLPGVACYGVASILSAYFTNQMGKPQYSLYIASLSLCLGLALSVILIPRYGMIGGAVATTLSYIISVVVSVRLFLVKAEVNLSAFAFRTSDFSYIMKQVRHLGRP